MTDLMSTLLFVVLSFAGITLSMTVRTLSKELDEIKEVVEHLLIKLSHIDFEQLPDHEQRLDQLEEALELKEYFEEEQLNKEENE